MHIASKGEGNMSFSTLAARTVASGAAPPIRRVRPRQDSNLRTRLRRAVLYPLSYGGNAVSGRCRDALEASSEGLVKTHVG